MELVDLLEKCVVLSHLIGITIGINVLDISSVFSSISSMNSDTQSVKSAPNRREITDEYFLNVTADMRAIDPKWMIKLLKKSLPKLPKRKRVPIPKGVSKVERGVWAVLRDVINADNSIGPNYGHYMAWEPGDERVTLDSQFTVNELEALVWWMKNKNKAS